MLKGTYDDAAHSPRLPERIEGDGLLVGWSIAHLQAKQSMGINIGDACSSRSPALVDPILFGAEGHLITIASTGAGKGVGCIVPALLSHDGPMIVIDPKGENAAITRRYREEVLGQRVYVLDPLGIVTETSDCLNPLDAVDPADPACVDEAAAMAESLGQHIGSGGEQRYWNDRGVNLIAALILHAASSRDPKERTLAAVRANLGHGLGGGEHGAVPDAANPLYQLLSTSPHPEARRAAASVRNLAEVTLGSIVSVAQSLVDFVRGQPVMRATSSSSFPLEDVTRGEPMTIYIVLPPHMLESHAPLLRLWLNALLKATMRRRHRVPRPTLLILDEAAQLGEFPPLRQAITLLRGYGLQTWSFWQDLSQLKHAYPTSWETIINNCQVVQAFGAPNMSAARSLSDLFMMPHPEVVLDLAPEQMILQMRGADAVVAQRPNYLTDPAFAGRFDPNPRYVDQPPPEPRRAPVRRLETVLARQTVTPPRPDNDADFLADLIARYGA